jgi:uncharacterized membrane protein YccC
MRWDPRGHGAGRLLRIGPSPVPWGPALRGALGIGVTLTIGLWAHNAAAGVLAAFGAMHATFNDRDEPQRLRTLRIATAVLGSAAGMAVGAALQVSGADWGLLPALTLVGFLAGVISTLDPLAAGACSLLMVSSALGSGITLPDPAWSSPLLILAGGGFVMLLTPWRRPGSRRRPQERVIAAVFTEQARLLSALGTLEAVPARRRLTTILAEAHDTVVLASPLIARPYQRRLLFLYDAALHVTEAATGLLWFGQSVPPEVARVPHALADAVLAGRPAPVTLPRWRPENPGQTALAKALQAAARTAAAPMPAATRHARTPTARRLRSREAAVSGLRLALCIAAASGLSILLHEPRSYWLPLTVAFVLRPDLGSVYTRAIHRSLGTLLGVLGAGALLAVFTSPWTLIAAAALFAALLPITVARHYAFNIAAVTPLVLLLVQIGGGPDIEALGLRLIDTVIASLIVLLLGYAPWPQARAARITPRLKGAVTAVQAYLAVVATRKASTAQRAALRLTAYRALADTHRTLNECLSEPSATARRAVAWLPAAHALERLTDAVSAAAIQIEHGGPPPSPHETALLRAALEDLSQALRQHRPPRLRATPTPTVDRRDPSTGALAHAAEDLNSALEVGTD